MKCNNAISVVQWTQKGVQCTKKTWKFLLTTVKTKTVFSLSFHMPFLLAWELMTLSVYYSKKIIILVAVCLDRGLKNN